MTVKKISSRTEYRKMRRQLIKDSVMLLVDMLDMKEKDLEAIKIPFFKKLHKTIENRSFE
jgi:hypothetical protein